MFERNKVYTRLFSFNGVIPLLRIVLVASLFLIPVNLTKAQTEDDLYEINVFTEIPKVGGSEIPAVIDGEELFISVTDLFSFLRIKNTISDDGGQVSGFFINPDANYIINRSERTITFSEKVYPINEGDIIKSETGIYLKSDYFAKVFGLDCQFNFRNLSVTIITSMELPAIREMKQEQIRKNLNRLKGEIVADTIIKRSFPLFRFGMADWSVHSTQEIKGQSNNRINLNLGAMIAGGEFLGTLTFNTISPFSQKDQSYLWRYADNDQKLFKQFTIGKINSQPIATISSNIVGVQLTNTPTTYRRSFGAYTLSDRTEPGWIVELYVNNVLVDYLKADASGFYQFQVPLVYGSSAIKLKFFGPWGEEKTKEETINIPYNFIPEKTIEYKISAGFLEDSLLSRYTHISLNYGLSRHVTIGGGLEYLSYLKNTPLMPFLNASISILDNLLLSGEYTQGVRIGGTISYRTSSNIQMSLDYTKYEKDQEALFHNYLEERKGSVSIPLKLGKASLFNRLSVDQKIIPSSRISIEGIQFPPLHYTTAEWTISSYFFGIGANIATYATILDDRDAAFHSNLSMALKLPAKFVLRPQLNYDYNGARVLSARLGAEKNIGKNAYMNASFERSFVTNTSMAEVGFRYNFGFAQTGASARNSGGKTTLTEYARGSLIYDRKTDYVRFANQYSVGKGAISVIPYLDLNANGLKDKGEPKAYGLNLHVNSGRVEKSENDTTIVILGLEPYTNCFIDLDDNSFENISWRLPVKILNVAVDPEIVKHIEIPITVVGEASGNVKIEDPQYEDKPGGVILRFLKDHKISGSTMTEDDGYYSLFGLEPGNYTVQPDSNQLKKLGLISEPLSINFAVTPGLDGDIINGLDFKLKPVHPVLPPVEPTIVQPEVQPDTLVPVAKKPEPVIRKDTSVLVVHEVFEELVTISKDSWAIQLGAFKNRSNAENLRRRLESQLGRKVEIVIADDFFKVRINEIPDRAEVDKIIEVLKKNDISEVWIIGLKAKQQLIVLRERQDSVIKVTETKVEAPEIFESKIFMPMNEIFYKLERPKSVIIDPTIIKLMKSHSELRKMKFKEIRPNVRIIRSDTVEIKLTGDIPANIALSLEPVEEVIDPVAFNYAVPELASKPVNEINRETAPKLVKVPKISLQVGVYYKKSEAARVKKKIQSKLNVPVKIVEQWEYYRVIITGFTSREETYQYYPELAGMGLPAPVLLEE